MRPTLMFKIIGPQAARSQWAEERTMVHSKIGTLHLVDGDERIVVEKGQKGCILYGPYIPLGPGRYAVDFDIVVTGSASLFGTTCRLDVTGNIGTQTLASEDLSSSALRTANGRVSLPFVLAASDVVEFRVFSTGRDDLSVSTRRALGKMDEATGQLVSTHDESAPALYRQKEREFNFYRQHGIAIDHHDGNVIANRDGLRVHILSNEDIQVIDEVFMRNTYNISTSREAIVIDIGMNAGIASLYFAAHDKIREVHSFEPFNVPFERACKNFALNPTFAQKIVPSRFGLGGEDCRLEVMVDPEQTIGTSIRGVGAGVAETIEIRKASDVFRPISERARAEGFDLIVKMDCEGSEFAIIDRLESEGLLGSFKAIVIEWHKWWSEEKSQADLVGPLMRAGFVVIDHTHIANPHGGILYGVKAA